jgi:hypothetical protein
MPPSVDWNATLEPWHCWQPEKALAKPFTEENPGIVAHWEGSTHAEKGVGCVECHQAARDEADSYLHHGEQIATIVTPRAVARRHDGRDLLAMVQVAVGLLARGLVALYTPHALLGMGASLPVRDDAGILLGVAFHALARRCRYGDVRGSDPRFLGLSSRLHPLHQHQGEQEQPAQGSDHDPLGLETHVYLSV